MNLSNIFSGWGLSISSRFTLWYGVTLLVLLSLFAVFSYTTFHWAIHRDFDRHLVHEKRELLPHVRGKGRQLSFDSLEEVRSVAYRTDGRYGTYVRLLTPEGGEITVSTWTENGQACLEVSDTGIGLEPGAAEHLFDRFYRASDAKVQQQPGSGLGLAIVEAYNGWIEARSAGPGKGSTFTAAFPL